MVQLQKPRLAYMGGRLRPWDQAVLHVGCEAVNRGLNVFEGIKGYWQADGRFAVVELRRHYERLRRSARLLHIPFDMPYGGYADAVFLLIGELVEAERDMWARTTLFVTEGHWGEGTRADLVVTAYHQEKAPPPSIALGVSTWQRSADVSLPARIKTATNYQVARLARIEGRARNCQDMVLLNQWGRVAESTGSCLLMVRDDVVYTPPPTEGALESITVDLVEALARSLGIQFVRRPIDRTELLIANELALCGTLAEIQVAHTIEGLPLTPTANILGKLQTRYLNAMRGIEPHPAVDLVAVPVSSRQPSTDGEAPTRHDQLTA